MARTLAEDEAIRRKVNQLMEQLGYPLERAQATAFRMYRDGELDIVEQSKELNELQEIYRASLLDGFLTVATSRRLYQRRLARRQKILARKS